MIKSKCENNNTVTENINSSCHSITPCIVQYAHVQAIAGQREIAQTINWAWCFQTCCLHGYHQVYPDPQVMCLADWLHTLGVVLQSITQKLMRMPSLTLRQISTAAIQTNILVSRVGYITGYRLFWGIDFLHNYIKIYLVLS